MGLVKAETINLKGQSYELVKSRVKRLHEKFPGASITTDLIDTKYNEAGYLQSVIVRATIDIQGENNQIQCAQGMSMSERTRGGQIGFLEKCETAAIGRALASLGFISDGTGFASGDEMQKFEAHETREQKKDW